MLAHFSKQSHNQLTDEKQDSRDTTYICICRLSVPEHAKNSKDGLVHPYWPPIGMIEVGDTNCIWLEKCKWKVDKLITAVECRRLPVPGKEGFDDRWD
jgi:hypothetical protein